MRALYPHASTKAVAAILGRSRHVIYAAAIRLGLRKSPEYLASPAACRLRRGDNVGAPFRFKPGHVPANKGLRRPGYAPGRMRETQFKKGQTPHTWMPVGATRLVDGYRYTKISDRRCVPWTRNWKPTHVLLWERRRGRMPKHHCLLFNNGDRTDIRMGNLCLAHRRENMRRNSVHNLPPAMVQVIQLRGALVRQIRRRTA